jgi:hypothetical protein
VSYVELKSRCLLLVLTVLCCNYRLVLRVACSDVSADCQVSYTFDYAWSSAGIPLSLSNVNMLFAINDTLLGVITVTNSSMFVSYPNDGVIALGVTATDGTGQSSSVRFNFTIAFGNFAPVVPPGQARVVMENAVVGTVVGTAINATDEDGPVMIFEFAAAPSCPSAAVYFGINATSGQLRVIKSGLDFESVDTPTVFEVIVTVFDSLVRTSTLVTITLLDVDEVRHFLLVLACVCWETHLLWSDVMACCAVQPPVCSPPSAPLRVSENVVSAVLGTLTCVDPDAGANLTFSIVSAVPSTPAGAFSVAWGSNLAYILSSVQPLDFERIKTYGVTVRAIDNGVSRFSTTVLVPVEVVNVNEPPVFFVSAPPPVMFLENTTVGTIITSFSIWYVVDLVD